MGLSKVTRITSPTSTSFPTRVRKRRFRGCDSGGGRDSPHKARVPSKKGRVSFEMTKENTVKTSETFIDILRSELDKPNMWWSREEREGILEECEEAIYDFRVDHVDHISQYLSAFEHCSRAPSQASSDFLETVELNVPVNARGMEWGWAQSTKGHRREHVREVLELQEQIQGLNPIMRDRVLSSKSLRSSRPGRVMARLLGESDERNAPK